MLQETPQGSRILTTDTAEAAPVPQVQELEAPASFTSPEVLYQDLINSIRRYHPSDDITLVAEGL